MINISENGYGYQPLEVDTSQLDLNIPRRNSRFSPQSLVDFFKTSNLPIATVKFLDMMCLLFASFYQIFYIAYSCYIMIIKGSEESTSTNMKIIVFFDYLFQIFILVVGGFVLYLILGSCIRETNNSVEMNRKWFFGRK